MYIQETSRPINPTVDRVIYFKNARPQQKEAIKVEYSDQIAVIPTAVQYYEAELHYKVFGYIPIDTGAGSIRYAMGKPCYS